MSKQKQNYEPLLVKNPHTGELVDVFPLFKFLDDLETNRTNISIEIAQERVLSVTEALSTFLDDEYFETKIEDFKSNMSFLFTLQSFLNHITVYRKEVNNA